jgi:hypothetical protein
VSSNALIPPLRELPPGRSAERARHLRAEIARQQRPVVAVPIRRRVLFAAVVTLALSGVLLATPAFGLRDRIVHLFAADDNKRPPQLIQRYFRNLDVAPKHALGRDPRQGARGDPALGARLWAENALGRPNAERRLLYDGWMRSRPADAVLFHAGDRWADVAELCAYPGLAARACVLRGRHPDPRCRSSRSSIRGRKLGAHSTRVGLASDRRRLLPLPVAEGALADRQAACCARRRKRTRRAARPEHEGRRLLPGRTESAALSRENGPRLRTAVCSGVEPQAPVGRPGGVGRAPRCGARDRLP